MAKEDFYKATVAGDTYVASMSGEGPYFERLRKNGLHEGVALGNVAVLAKVTHDRDRRTLDEPTWAVCKYNSRQPKMVLRGYSDDQVAELSKAFGLVTAHNGQPPIQAFAASPAWPALKAWVAKHPRIAASHEDCDSYMPGWHEWAVEENAAAKAGASMSGQVAESGHEEPSAPRM
jgi:hypothetical protein